MSENILSDAKLRTASRERDGQYLSDGGGLRIRLLSASPKHPKGAKLCEFHFKLKDAAGDYRNGAIHLGTIGDTFADATGKARAFTLKDARAARDAARELVSRGIDPREARRLADVEAVEGQRRRLLALESRRTVRQAFERWRELYLSAHHKDGGAMVADLYERHILPAIGDTPLEELKRHQITDALDGITARGLRRTANMALASIRQLVRWCQLRDWIGHDPTLALTKAELAAMRKRWARRRAARLAKPEPLIAPEELHRLAIEKSRRKVAGWLALVEYKRRKAAEADAAGEHSIAKTLRLLASHHELTAALEVASRRERERGFARGQRVESNRAHARKPRPKARRPIREAILQTLAPLKREGIEFRSLMRRWRVERIGSLRLDDLGGGRFRIADEDGDASDAATYTRATLQRLYSESKRVLTASTG